MQQTIFANVSKDISFTNPMFFLRPFLITYNIFENNYNNCTVENTKQTLQISAHMKFWYKTYLTSHICNATEGHILKSIFNDK